MRRRAQHTVRLCHCCCHYQLCNLNGVGGGVFASTRLCMSTRPRGWNTTDPAAAERRAAFQNYIRVQNLAFTSADALTTPGAASFAVADNGQQQQPTRHVLETIEVRPVSRTGPHGDDHHGPTEDRREGSYKSSQKSNQQVGRSPAARGQRDLQHLRHVATSHFKLEHQNRLRAEYRRAVGILRDILEALEKTVEPRRLEHRIGAAHLNEERLTSTEAIRFERMHQLRDTTSCLSAAHFFSLPYEEVLRFLEIVGRIVSLVQEPHMTAHGYVVREALCALFRNGVSDGISSAPPSPFSQKRKPFSGTYYFKLLRIMLSLPVSESTQVLDGRNIPVSVEELCVRRLGGGVGGTSPDSASLLCEIGTARAVRVVTWCMHSAASDEALTPRSRRGRRTTSGSSSLSSHRATRIPFGVGKEYTQSVLTYFAPRASAGRVKTEPAPEMQMPTSSPFGVSELATLCSAIVFYEIASMDALDVLVGAAPTCAMQVEELSGHQLSSVLLAYASLKYHGDLSRHSPWPAEELWRKNDSSSGVGCDNFYLILGERAGKLGERLHEDDAARVLRALAMSGVEHEGLRRSLESSMRMKKLQHRVLLSGG